MREEHYSPLYVGPLRRAEPVRRALADAASELGIGVADGQAVLDGAPAEAVGLVPLRAASWMLQQTIRRRWVVVGDVDPDRLPAAFLARLDEAGLIYDTRQLPAPPSRASAMASALAARAAMEGAWVMVMEADGDRAPVVAAEAAVRLRVLGYTVGAVWKAGRGGMEGAPIPAGPRPGLVAHLDDTDVDAVSGLAARARAAGASLVLVGAPAVTAEIAAARQIGAGDVVRTSREAVPDAVRQASWPAARDMLTGAPTRGPERELISLVDADGRDLSHIVRAAASWERAGFLLVFTHERFGWIALDGAEGRVGGAWRLGDAEDQAPGTVLARIRAMSLWAGIRALFVSSDPPRPPGAWAADVLVDTVDLDIRRTLDEVRHQRVPPGQVPLPASEVRPSRVAEELLAWGQPRFAHELLRAAERASAWSVEEELLFGYLSVEHDPREAAGRLRHAAGRLSDDLAGDRWSRHVDATLAALLLDVRAHGAQAEYAWGVVERWIESQGEDWTRTPRRAGVLYELAARAGETHAARRFRDIVVELSAPGDVLPEWVHSSDPLRVGGAAR
ncbi:hypothetical protein [Longimicrobium terrae]|uniref:Uncharacterized protein n=1 Tax=Longimicrobium terrae TaxID=1639882 RepID=A0A841GWS5_9BACT|nr:hypothetical protein [Longimicrobium terrae]MBB4636008.1 hypothetical protein [Longimicrobium terrae]MBB6070404.1 hypothetical protein [Longimicrobium terrae]NNC30898.1 hypothetical protein [Longimicrobium terrae]